MKRIIKLADEFGRFSVNGYRDFTNERMFVSSVQALPHSTNEVISIMRTFIPFGEEQIITYPLSDEAEFYGVTCYSYDVEESDSGTLVSMLEDVCYGKYLVAIRSKKDYTMEAHITEKSFGSYSSVKRLAVCQPVVVAMYAYADDEFGYWNFLDCTVEEKSSSKESPFHYFLVKEGHETDGALHFIYPTCDAERFYLKRQFDEGKSPYYLALRLDR